MFNTIWDDAADSEANIKWTRYFWSDMKKFSSGGLYLNFPGEYEEGQDLMKDAFGSNYDRLVEVKNRYDPENLFRGVFGHLFDFHSALGAGHHHGSADIAIHHD